MLEHCTWEWFFRVFFRATRYNGESRGNMLFGRPFSAIPAGRPPFTALARRPIVRESWDRSLAVSVAGAGHHAGAAPRAQIIPETNRRASRLGEAVVQPGDVRSQPGRVTTLCGSGERYMCQTDQASCRRSMPKRGRPLWSVEVGRRGHPSLRPPETRIWLPWSTVQPVRAQSAPRQSALAAGDSGRGRVLARRSADIGLRSQLRG